MLLGAVVLVLLITCANLAALLVRAPAGARARWRCASASAPPAAASCASSSRRRRWSPSSAPLAALVLASWLVPVLVRLAPPTCRACRRSFRPRVALVCLRATVATACLFGVAPALVATRVQPRDVLRAESGRASAGRARQRLRQALTLAQTRWPSCCCVGAGLLVRSLYAPRRASTPASSREGVVAARAAAPRVALSDVARLGRRSTPRGGGGARCPGVESVALASGDPFDGGFGARFGIEGRPPFEKGQRARARHAPGLRPATSRAAGVRLVRGRDFAPPTGWARPGAVS